MREIRFIFISFKRYYAKQLINSILIGLITDGRKLIHPLAVILKENKLTGPNYIDWKRNLNLVLTAQEYKFVLTDVCSPTPGSDSLKEDVEAY